MNQAAIQPFSQLDDDTEAALRASIKKFGVIVPIVIDGGGRVIDGHHRKRIAHELNLSCPSITRRVRDDDEANALAFTLNADRRQMTREQRKAVVVDLRDQGFSLRAIAGVVGVSHTQVATELTTGSGVNRFTPVDLDPETGEVLDSPGSTTPPPRVTGTDGKSYPATRPVKNPDKTRAATEARWEKVRQLAAEGLTSRQIAPAVGLTLEGLRNGVGERDITIPADALVRNTRHVDPNRLVGETVAQVESAAFALTVVPLDYSGLDPDAIEGWVSSLSKSLRSLTTLRNNLKKELPQ